MENSDNSDSIGEAMKKYSFDSETGDISEGL